MSEKECGIVPLCECDCGQHTLWNKKKKRFNRFVNGHQNRGENNAMYGKPGATKGGHRTKETKIRMGKSQIKRYKKQGEKEKISGKNNGMYGKVGFFSGKRHTKMTIKQMKKSGIERWKRSGEKEKIKKIFSRPEVKARRSGKNNSMFGRTGEKHPMFGKFGENAPNFKKDVTRRGISDSAEKIANRHNNYIGKHDLWELVGEDLHCSKTVIRRRCGNLNDFLEEEDIKVFPLKRTGSIGKNELYHLNIYEKEHNVELIKQFSVANGFYVDGYDLMNKIAVEVDEDHHFDKDGNYKIEDVIREHKIKAVLNCTFHRIKDLGVPLEQIKLDKFVMNR